MRRSRWSRIRPGVPTTICAPSRQRIELRAVGRPAIDASVRIPLPPASRIASPATCWASSRVGTSDQCLAGVQRRIDPVKDRQHERAGLAAARARLDHHVAALQQVGDRRRLDVGQLAPPRPLGRLAQQRRQVFEDDRRQGIVRLHQLRRRLDRQLRRGRGLGARRFGLCGSDRRRRRGAPPSRLHHTRLWRQRLLRRRLGRAGGGRRGRLRGCRLFCGRLLRQPW